MRRAVATSLNARHLLLVMFNTLRFALRSGTGVIFVLIVFYFGMTPCGFLLSALEKGEKITEERGFKVEQEDFLGNLSDLTSDKAPYAP